MRYFVIVETYNFWKIEVCDQDQMIKILNVQLLKMLHQLEICLMESEILTIIKIKSFLSVSSQRKCNVCQKRDLYQNCFLGQRNTFSYPHQNKNKNLNKTALEVCGVSHSSFTQPLKQKVDSNWIPAYGSELMQKLALEAIVLFKSVNSYSSMELLSVYRNNLVNLAALFYENLLQYKLVILLPTAYEIQNFKQIYQQDYPDLKWLIKKKLPKSNCARLIRSERVNIRGRRASGILTGLNN
ncbi:hypothetical protein BpHYR1_052504 [Brachionus plicatilis]|uniref:Uncharacterized protein n=1 Tax=Brachionus plicatilis TaxID=10195 RepID=A0A3M7SWC2_BRAPC|nr:hypothetical protein BpHYR1_052504 [Brachionus plicatilis]